MNDIDKIPVKCRDCPYWELASYPWCCGDCTNRLKKPVSDFVSRQWLIDEYHRRHQGPPGGALKMIEEAPAADVEPVRHGRWIPGKAVYSKYDGGHLIARYYDRWTCSVCNYVINDQHYSRISYKRYPECGAKMDKEEEDV